MGEELCKHGNKRPTLLRHCDCWDNEALESELTRLRAELEEARR